MWWLNKNKLLGLIGLARRAGKIDFGTQSSTDTIKRKKAKLIIMAQDISDRTKKNFETLCNKEKIEYRIFGTIDELSNCIGQNNKAVICIKDENFSNEIKKIIDGGEVIG